MPLILLVLLVLQCCDARDLRNQRHQPTTDRSGQVDCSTHIVFPGDTSAKCRFRNGFIGAVPRRTDHHRRTTWKPRWGQGQGQGRNAPGARSGVGSSNAVTPDLENRFLFDGSKCPSGEAKINGLCVAIDSDNSSFDYYN